MPGILQVTAAVIREKNRILVSSRPSGKKHAGKWEFPGGKIEPGETPAECVVRELKEELGLSVLPLDTIFDFVHSYAPDFSVHLIFIRCIRMDRSEPLAKEGQRFCWQPVTELPELDFLDADKPIALLLANALRQIR